MTALEREVESRLRKKIEARGGKCLKWVCPGWGGVPDRIILLPGGRIYFVETKRPKCGVVSELQKKWREWLTKLGFDYSIVWNLDAVEGFIHKVEADEMNCDTCAHKARPSFMEPCDVCKKGNSQWRERE